MTDQLRKKTTGEPTNNGGEFGHKQHAEAEVELTTSEIRSHAQSDYAAAHRLLVLSAAKAIAETILAEHPNASYVSLEESDQGYGHVDGEIRSWDDEYLADALDFELYDELHDLPTVKPTTVVRTETGTRYENDPDYAWLIEVPSDQRYVASTFRIDLAAASQIKLS